MVGGGVFKAPASLCNVHQGFGGKTSGLLNGNLHVVMYNAAISYCTSTGTKVILHTKLHTKGNMALDQITHKLHEYTYIIELNLLTSK